MNAVKETWRIDVEQLRDGEDAENAAKYWAGRPGRFGKIDWEHKPSELFGAVSPAEAAALAGTFVVATFVGAPCTECGETPEGITVPSRAAATAKLSRGSGTLCASCQEAKLNAANEHVTRVQEWLASFQGSLPPDELESLDEILLLDKLTQSDPFKDRRLRGNLLDRAHISNDDIGRLFELGIIVPTAVSRPSKIVFGDEGTTYYPFEMDWQPAGEGRLEDRFGAIERLSSQEIHGAADKYPREVETLAGRLIVMEAERYLMQQLSNRGIDVPTEAQMARFRDSIADAWTDFGLAQFYYAIWPACAKAVDAKARHSYMGRDAVTGSAVNAIVKGLDDFRSGRLIPKSFDQPYDLPLDSRTVTLFRIALDLDPLSALATDVAAVLGTEPEVPAAPEELLEGARMVHAACLESMPEKHAFTAAMASLNLLVRYYDLETINAARAAFAGERMGSRFAIPGSD